MTLQRGNAKRGKRVEAFIDEQNAWLDMQGRAFVFRVPEEMKITSSNEAVKTGFTKGHTFLDFAGSMQGRFVGLEVKSIKDDPSKPYFPFSKLNRKQTNSARRAAAHGGVVLVYVRRMLRTGATVDYLFPFDSRGNIAYVDTRKSVPWEHAEPFKVNPGELWLDCYERLSRTGIIQG